MIPAMTDQECIRVINARMNGKTVLAIHRLVKEAKFFHMIDADLFDFACYYYKIKPDPVLRAWTIDEARGKWIVTPKKDQFMITRFNEHGNAVLTSTFTPSLEWIRDNCKQPDKSPCGVMEENHGVSV